MTLQQLFRTTNLVMACHLMFLYSNYRLIGIAHQQATQPMTEQEANERACLLNGLFNADLSGYDFLGNSETAVDDAIDRYQDYEKLKDKVCVSLYLRNEVIVREVQRRSALEGTLGMSKTRNNIN